MGRRFAVTASVREGCGGSQAQAESLCYTWARMKRDPSSFRQKASGLARDDRNGAKRAAVKAAATGTRKGCPPEGGRYRREAGGIPDKNIGTQTARKPLL